MSILTEPFPERPGATYWRVCLRGTAEILVYPLLFGAGRVGIGPTDSASAAAIRRQYDDGMDRVYDYTTLDDAVRAAHGWDGNGDPDGFYRRAGDQVKPPANGNGNGGGHERPLPADVA